MQRILLTCLLLTTLFGRSMAQAADDAKNSKPIRALLIVGGCCHDYDRQKLILTRGVSARANVVWTVVHQGGTATNSRIPLYEDPNWADGFDIVVHNECFSDVPDVEWVERILKPHREGLPAILIHCAMHSYRTKNDKWFEFVGVQSPGHGAHYPYLVENQAPDHWIMKPFGPRWEAPKGELYHTIKVWPSATPLATAKRQDNNEPQVCVWTNKYGKGNVFATTIGHYSETVAEPAYLDMLTRGLLWAVGRTDESEFKMTDKATDDAIRKLVTDPIAEPEALPVQKCCVEGNLAHDKPTKADSEETGKNNFAKNAVDGNLKSRWCANNGAAGHWWQVDFGKPEHVKSLRIHWEGSNAAYRYKIEASPDENTWKTIVDQSENKKVAGVTPHEVDSPDTRFLKVTFLGTNTGGWGSFWEFEAYADKLPPLPESAQSNAVSSASLRDVQVNGEATTADGKKIDVPFNVTLFGKPPEVNYPVCIAAAPTGELFVGVDEQGSLGKEPGRGKIVRCVDRDGDRRADQFTDFAKVDHPRGLIYDNGSLWVLHTPTLSVFHDDNRDGVADRHQVLVTGLSTDQVEKRGADHTTNGIRMGIDGWIYIAVGDFGFVNAKGTDGRTLTKRGGGVVRVRPDGTELEVYAWGLRNIVDIGIDPLLNLYTRDNTNDGGGWDIRVSHILQSANYGYPSLYLNFPDEIMPTLAVYGGGSGCGAMYFHDLRWPAPFSDAFYSCDWGRSEVYRHNLPSDGPTFAAHQETFLKIPRPTDMDADGSGRMFVSSWKDGNFNFTGPNVGFVACITPQNFTPKPFPYLSDSTDAQLAEWLCSPSEVYRLHSQREFLRRGDDATRRELILAVARDAKQPIFGRVAAINTFHQMTGANGHPALLSLLQDASIREYTLRALTDRRTHLGDLPLEPFVAALSDENPRVRAQAVVSIGRLGRPEAAVALLPLTRRTGEIVGTTAHTQPDADRVIPHLAVQSLVSLGADDVCIKALDGPDARGALWALRSLHTPHAVDGLIKQLAKTRDSEMRHQILTTLARLYYREGDYKGDWWGTRPDTSGPYYDRQLWAMSDRIGQVLKTAVADSDPQMSERLRAEVIRHKLKIDGLPTPEDVAESLAEMQKPIVVPMADPGNPNQIANIPYDAAFARAEKLTGDVEKGRLLFTSQSCIACHTYADGQKPKGPHLVDIGKRYKRTELIESILKPSNKIAQGFDTYAFVTSEGKVFTGFVVGESADTLRIRQNDGVLVELAQDDIEDRRKQELSMMPLGLANNLTPEQLADLLAYLESLK